MEITAHDGSNGSLKPLATKLPGRNPDRMWGGPSLGGDCARCDQPIGRGELELEIEFDCDDGASERYRVHVRCLSA
jgi:hypothetical protein